MQVNANAFHKCSGKCMQAEVDGMYRDVEK